ncbi:uncharacterized protein [Procambarus clarkii]|uniref:uncharacterized protein n=1 Tax=Procambarus clarkii TaxID=6728 RepID=UPI0037437324
MWNQQPGTQGYTGGEAEIDNTASTPGTVSTTGIISTVTAAPGIVASTHPPHHQHALGTPSPSSTTTSSKDDELSKFPMSAQEARPGGDKLRERLVCFGSGHKSSELSTSPTLINLPEEMMFIQMCNLHIPKPAEVLQQQFFWKLKRHAMNGYIRGQATLIRKGQGPNIPVSVASPDAPASSSQPDTTLTSQPDTTLTSQPDTTLTSQPDTTLTSQPDTTLTSQPDTTLTSQPDTTLTSQPDTTLTSQPDTTLITVEVHHLLNSNDHFKVVVDLGTKTIVGSDAPRRTRKELTAKPKDGQMTGELQEFLRLIPLVDNSYSEEVHPYSVMVHVLNLTHYLIDGLIKCEGDWLCHQEAGRPAPQVAPGAAATTARTAQVAPGAAATTARTAQVAPGAARTPARTAQVAPGAAATPARTAQVAPGAATTPARTAQVAPGAATTPARTAQVAPGAATTPAPHCSSSTRSGYNTRPHCSSSTRSGYNTRPALLK